MRGRKALCLRPCSISAMTSVNSAYSHLPRFHVGVDCIIFAIKNGKLDVLLVRRDFEPEKGKWSLIGGFVKENESVDQAAKRVLRDLTGLDNVFIRQLGAFGEVERDPGASGLGGIFRSSEPQ